MLFFFVFCYRGISMTLYHGQESDHYPLSSTLPTIAFSVSYIARTTTVTTTGMVH
jgi:hypothetical protein